MSALLLPIAALVLPTLAVFASTYSGCAANEGGVGDCTLWGAEMGMAFHTAATAPWLLYDIVPYSLRRSHHAGADRLDVLPRTANGPLTPLSNRADASLARTTPLMVRNSTQI